MYDDEFAGQGGSYTQDPKTGKRTRVEEPTVSPADDAAVLDNAEDEVDSVKAKKATPQTDFSLGA